MPRRRLSRSDRSLFRDDRPARAPQLFGDSEQLHRSASVPLPSFQGVPMTSFLGHINRAELLKAWKSSGVAFLVVTAVVAGLQYAQGVLANDGANSILAGLGAALISQLVGQLKALRDGLPPPPPISPKS